MLKALLAAGMLAQWRGDNQQSIALYEEAVRLWRELGDLRRVPYLLNLSGNVVDSAGDLARAQVCWEQALALARELGDQTNMARSLANLGYVADQHGDEERALNLWQESLTLARAAGNSQVLARSLSQFARLAERRGDTEQAAALHNECLALYRDLGLLWGISRALEAIARIAAGWGQARLAICLWAAAARVRQPLGAPIPAAISGARYSRDDDAHTPGVADVRTTLGDDDFERAWAAGMSMPLEAVIAEALAMAPNPTGEHVPGSLDTASQHGLSPREIDVLRLIAAGRSNRQIAAELFISTRTAERHIENLYQKLDVHNRTDAITRGRANLT